jgi:hypothetical protein
MDADGWVTGVVAVDVSEIVGKSLEHWLDMLSTYLVGNELLEDIDWHVVGRGENDIIHVQVSGDAGLALKDDLE